MKFAREGYPLIFGSGVVALVLHLLAGWWAGLLALILTLFIASFFRDPEREIPEGEGLVVSPADGRVTAIDADRSPEGAPGEKFQRVSIFMSPLNVHVNRAPEDGTVVSVKHTPGRFVAAYDERASTENERNEVVMHDPKGRTLVFVQIAGLLARRIICRLSPGDRVARGERMGLIMFGSKVDVYLPASARVLVRVGERVRAGSHVLGELA
ncbi:MAG: phosphatidylserine decarboxylase family protein [Candidatus Binatia bacterium]